MDSDHISIDDLDFLDYHHHNIIILYGLCRSVVVAYHAVFR